jgi:hypothetical protein
MTICEHSFEMARSTLLNKSVLLKKGTRDYMYSIVKIIKRDSPFEHNDLPYRGLDLLGCCEIHAQVSGYPKSVEALTDYRKLHKLHGNIEIEP